MLGSQRGHSLIEIVVAMVLFGLGLSLAMQVLPTSNSATTRGRNVTKATNLAQEKIEDLMSQAFSNADLVAGAHTDPDNPIDNNFRRSWTITDDVPVPGMKQVLVAVSFETGSSDSTATLETYITSRR